MKPRLAFVLGMTVVAVLLAPFLPWKSWKEQLTARSNTPPAATVAPAAQEDTAFQDRTRPYLLVLREEDRETPVRWQLFVEPPSGHPALSAGAFDESRVSGHVFKDEHTYDVYGSVVTSTDQLVYRAYDGFGETLATATTTWNGQMLRTEARWAREADTRRPRLEQETADTVRLTFTSVADRWEDPKRSMACDFRLTFPVVEQGGPVSRAAADAINRALRAQFLGEKMTPEQVKNTYLRECRTELEEEAQWLKGEGGFGASLQRSWLVGVSVVRNRSPWLSLTLDEYTYTGGAHGSAGSSSLLFDVRTGRRGGLQDLLRDEAAIAAFHGLVAEKLLDQYNDALFEDQAAQLRLYVSDRSRQLERWRLGEIGYATGTTFTMTPSGVRVLFQQYEVAPYAVGMPTVDLPFSEWSSLASEEARRVFTTR